MGVFQRIFKRILTLMLAVMTVLPSLTACAKGDEGYITAGEFYALFIENTNLYSDIYSEEDIGDYEAAEYVLYVYRLIDDEQTDAYKQLVTKELVAQVCVRYMEFRQTCEAEIKDISKCHDQQAIIDSVGMGLFALENGYFDAKQNMTAEDCQEAIERMLEIEFNSHYEEGELEVEFKEDAIILDSGIEFEEWGVIEDPKLITTASFSGDGGKITTLSRKETSKDGEAVTLANANGYLVWFDIPRFDYQNITPKPAVGKIMVKPGFSGEMKNPGGARITPIDMRAPAAIRVTSIENPPRGKANVVRVYGTLATAEEYLQDSDAERGINKANQSKGAVIRKVPDNEVPEGVKIDTNTPGHVKVTFKHTFKLTDEIYGTQRWRNPSCSPSVTVTADIGNFVLDTKNIGKLILHKASSAHVKLTYDSAFTMTFSAGGMRYSPANNGNGGLKYDPQAGFSGHFLTNLTNSRFTGAAAGGSQKIKLAQIDIPLTSGFYINANLYLVVKFDGTITVEIKDSYCAELKVKDTLLGYKSSFNFGKVDGDEANSSKEFRLNANADLSAQLTPNIRFCGLNLIDAVGMLGVNIDTMASIYAVDANKSSAAIYATQEELDEQCRNSDFGYCMGIYYQAYYGYQCLTEESVIGKFVIKTLKLTTPHKKIPISQFCGGFHFEDGRRVDECTRGMGEIEKNRSGDIKLDSYKAALTEGSQVSVSVYSIPISGKQLEKTGGISVRSGNENIATVGFNPVANTLLITAVGEGSTEIAVRIPKNEKRNTYYEQKISITVSAATVVDRVSFVTVCDEYFPTKMRFC